MSGRKNRATVSQGPEAVATNHNNQNESYRVAFSESSRKRAERIAERRGRIPKTYRNLYDRAIAGKSRKAAMHIQCLECCGYEVKEVHACTDQACPLYGYRPQSRASHGAPESVCGAQESRKSC